MAFDATYDACVLHPAGLRDLLVRRRHLTRIANIQRNLAYGHPTGHYRRSTP